MAEGIKIRSLDITRSLVDSDVLIIDNVTADDLTTAVTKQIRYDDFITDLTGRDLVFSGEVIFNADISFDGNIDLTVGELSDVTLTDLQASQTLVYDGTQWVNGEASTGFNGDYIALKPHSAEATEDNIVHISVTVGPKVNHRFLNQGSGMTFMIDGQEAPFLIFTPGRTYKFDQSDPTNLGVSNEQQFRIRFYPFLDKGPFGNYLEEEGFVEYSSEAPGTPGAYSQIKLIANYQYITIYYDAQVENLMGNGIFNPDGSDQFSISPIIDSLQQQINTINKQLEDVIEIEEG